MFTSFFQFLDAFFSSDLVKSNLGMTIAALLAFFCLGAISSWLFFRYIWAKNLYNKIEEIKRTNRKLKREKRDLAQQLRNQTTNSQCQNSIMPCKGKCHVNPINQSETQNAEDSIREKD